jgi:DNA-binding MarR family transcriptional regulator
MGWDSNRRGACNSGFDKRCIEVLRFIYETHKSENRYPRPSEIIRHIEPEYLLPRKAFGPKRELPQGVYEHHTGKYQVKIWNVDGGRHIGVYATIAEAEAAYNEAKPEKTCSVNRGRYEPLRYKLRRLADLGCIALNDHGENFQWTYELNYKVTEEYLMSKDHTDPRRRILSLVISHVGKGHSFPTTQMLCKKSGYSRSVVYQKIAELSEMGLLQRSRIDNTFVGYQYDLEAITSDLLEKYDGMGSGDDDAETGAVGG